MSRSHVKSWEQVGPSITACPQASLAAWLGHAPSQQVLQNAGLLVPDMTLFGADTTLRDGLELGLSQDYLDMELLVRCAALWGPRALECVALACAELQIGRQTRCDAELVPLRNAAFEAARAHWQQPGPDTHAAAQQAAEACFDWWEPRYDDGPDLPQAREHWCQLGAPWLAAQTVADYLEFMPGHGDPPRAANKNWGDRNAVWPSRAGDAASEWSSLAEVDAAIRAALLAWALSETAQPGEFA